MSNISGNPVYNERAPARFPMTLSAAAQELGITVQRLSRYLKYFEVPVTRQGYSVLINRSGYGRVKRALTKQEVKRGRKKKTS